jgi:PPP family 3-phenylpropionic acid transporter
VSRPESGGSPLPFWRLSAFYLFYFGSLGALIPYWGPYLQSIGYSAIEIGQLMAVIGLTKVVAPNLWGWLADRSGRSISVVRVTSLLATVTFCGVFLSNSFWMMVAVMTVFSFFWNAALPQFEATTMNHLGQKRARYSVIRAWGSIGFIIAVVALGPLLDEGSDPGILPWIVAVLLAMIWLTTLTVPESTSPHRHIDHPPLLAVLRQKPVFALLLMAFLLQMSHGPYYTFFSIHLTEHHYSGTTTGWLWGLGVIAEVVLFMVMHRLLPRFGARKLLLWALTLTTLRWLATALLVDNRLAIIVSQLLHAASFGIFHAVTIDQIHHYFVGRLQGRGQALYSSLSFGAGGALGSLIAGYIWEPLGGTITYLMAALLAALSLLVCWWGVYDTTAGNHNPQPEQQT